MMYSLKNYNLKYVMRKLINFAFFTGISTSLISIIVILGAYASIKPNLPEIKYVDESQLQMPLKVFTKDGVLIGEFGEIKRRSLTTMIFLRT